jgi:2-iminoacetate synthase
VPFSEQIAPLRFDHLAERIAAATPAQVAGALSRERPGPGDLAALVSLAAGPSLRAIRERAAAVTTQRFGRTVNLYAPLYLSNRCTNHCTYCGFASGSDIERRDLAVEEAVENASILAGEGFRHVLLVTGEDPGRYGVGDIERVVEAIGGMFHSISIEVFPMTAGDYARLERAGVDGLTLYQETYDPDRYAAMHPAGPKRDFAGRLEAVEQGGEAGFRTLGIGALLGLSSWRCEAVAIAAHAQHLSRRFWRSRIAVSFPRIVPAGRGFDPPCPVTDDDLVHMMSALRLVLPDADFVVSTREPAALRDRLVGLAVTRMSAGSRTAPGAYVTRGAGEQFSVVDDRSPAEVADMLVRHGYDPVWKDFDRTLRG